MLSNITIKKKFNFNNYTFEHYIYCIIYVHAAVKNHLSAFYIIIRFSFITPNQSHSKEKLTFSFHCWPLYIFMIKSVKSTKIYFLWFMTIGENHHAWYTLIAWMDINSDICKTKFASSPRMSLPLGKFYKRMSRCSTSEQHLIINHWKTTSKRSTSKMKHLLIFQNWYAIFIFLCSQQLLCSYLSLYLTHWIISYF